MTTDSKIIYKSGYDVINDCFFVESNVEPKQEFIDFNDFFKYCDGNIYDNSCYYGIDKRKLPNTISIKKLTKAQSFINYTLKDKLKNIKKEFKAYVKRNKTTEKDVGKKGTTCRDKDITISVKKVFVEYEYRNKYVVIIELSIPGSKISECYTEQFEYFFDFVYFLNSDLSGSDLSECKGLVNLSTINNINFKDALLPVDFAKKFSIPIKELPQNTTPILFDESKINEKNSLKFYDFRPHVKNDDNAEFAIRLRPPKELSQKRVYYISDIHLTHIIKFYKYTVIPDIVVLVRKIVVKLFEMCEENAIILIAGDTATNFTEFNIFVEEIYKYFQCKRYDATIIFLLGNHEISSGGNRTFDKTVFRYQKILKSYGMYLLQNNIIYFNEFERVPRMITENSLCNVSGDKLRSEMRRARLIFFGGVGFSGCNSKFNANSGIYMENKDINRKVEIRESKKFEKLYNKICTFLYDKNVIVASHMPQPCWNSTMKSDVVENVKNNLSCYKKGFIYVSGHTHRNYYYEKDEIRVYSDNQFGYLMKKTFPYFKFFELDASYDYFSEFSDGKYTIKSDEYIRFCRGKGISPRFNKYKTVIMLKNKGIYCFLCKGKKGLLILNGGATKSLEYTNIDYYYKNLNSVEKIISNLILKNYNEFQKRISDIIKKIGGDGHIHGCIIDIDYYNHIYVNPYDKTVTSYYSPEYGEQYIYSSIPHLLEARRKDIYKKYMQFIEKSETGVDLKILGDNAVGLKRKSIHNFGYEMYQPSKYINRLQKVNKCMVVEWIEKNQSLNNKSEINYLEIKLDGNKRI